MKSKKEPYSGKSDSDFNADIENQYKNYKAGIYDKLKNKTVMDVRDVIAQNEFGMDYDQLGPGEKEWVNDEIED
jgi:hypothetical protein